jgi:hypothetical protein
MTLQIIHGAPYDITVEMKPPAAPKTSFLDPHHPVFSDDSFSRQNNGSGTTTKTRRYKEKIFTSSHFPPSFFSLKANKMFSVGKAAIQSVVKRQAQTRFASSLANSLASLKGEHFVSIDQLR